MNLTDMRKEIDEIDVEITRLLSKRFELAIRTRRHKESTHDTLREQNVIENVKGHSRFLLRPEFCEALFQTIMNEGRIIQEKNSHLVGFVGVHGRSTELAVNTKDSISIPYSNYQELYQGITNGSIDAGIIPFERVLEDSSLTAILSFLDSKLFITDEHEIKEEFSLLTLPTTDYRDVKIVYTHPDILSYAKDFLERTKLQAIPYHGSAEAALMLSTSRLQATAVIAPSLCASIYNLSIIKENILPETFTTARYLKIGKNKNTTGFKSALCIEITHSSGSLKQILEVFSKHSVNLTKLESLPTTSLSTAKFFIEFLADNDMKRTNLVIEEIARLTENCLELGNF